MMMVEKFILDGYEGIRDDLDSRGVPSETCPEAYGYEDLHGGSCPKFCEGTAHEREMTCAECWHRQYVEPEEVSTDDA